MNKRQFSLNKASKDCADRILAQTGIESYSELFNLLLRRYEHDFIQATNGFFCPQVITNGDKQVLVQPVVTNKESQMVTNGDKQVLVQPVVTNKDSQMVTNGDKQVQVPPKKTARQQLMDFE